MVRVERVNMGAAGRKIGATLVAVAMLGAGLGGCGGTGPQAETAPRATLQAPPRVQAHRHSLLLGFERDSDVLFVQAPGGEVRLAGEGARTGAGCLEVSGGGLEVKLSSLMSGRAFPGEWALLGGHVWADEAVEVEASLEVDGRPVLGKRQAVAAGTWTEVMLDLLPLARDGAVTQAQGAVLRFATSAPVGWKVDDVLLVDNRQVLVATEQGWEIRQGGHAYVVEQPRRFRIELQADRSQAGAWSMLEGNPLRAIFEQEQGGKRWVIYSDGRRYEDGTFKPTWDTGYNDDFAAQHRSPAQVSVPEEQGRVDRRSAGDANNDGYNEMSGSYRLVAVGGRLDVTLQPRTAQLVMPVLEIEGLPPGKVVVTLEGELVENVQRIGEGRVLVVVPHRIGRASTVNVRVQ